MTKKDVKLLSPMCGKCGVTGVRIYREFGSFRREETDRCNECIDQSFKTWMVPCCLDENGNAWGFTSVPDKDCEKFYALPEKSNSLPYWQREGGWSETGEDEIKRLSTKAGPILDEVRDLINEAYGECCPDYCEDCVVCQKHKLVDKLFEDFQ